MGLVGQKELPRPSVGRVLAAHHPPAFFQPVDVLAKAHAFDLKNIGERRLVDPLLPPKVCQQPVLSTGHPDGAGPAIETFTKQPRDVVQKKSKALVELL